MYKYRIVSFFAILIIFSSCRFKNEYINRKEDLEEGSAFLKMYYSKIKNKNFNDIDSFESDSLYLLAGRNGLSKLLRYIELKENGLKKYQVENFQVLHVTGSVNETYYNYRLKVLYKNGATEEIIGLKKLNAEPIKINSYHSYSPSWREYAAQAESAEYS